MFGMRNKTEDLKSLRFVHALPFVFDKETGEELREKDINRQQMELDRIKQEYGDGAEFTEEQKKLDDRRKKLKDDQELIRQYCALRKKYNSAFPDKPDIPGDRTASFLLAVMGPENKPQVVAGLRLHDVPAGFTPPDKEQMAQEVEEGKRKDMELARHERSVEADKIVRLEELFPGIDRAHFAVANVDGAFFNRTGLRYRDEVLPRLLDEMCKVGIDRGYDAVYLIPGTAMKLDETIRDYYADHAALKKRFVPIVDYGTAERHGEKKRILCVVMGYELMKFLPQMSVDKTGKMLLMANESPVKTPCRTH